MSLNITSEDYLSSDDFMKEFKLDNPDTLKIQLGLSSGLNPNMQDPKNGFTPLHYAMSKRWIEVVKILLENKETKLNILSKAGNTPLHLISDNTVHKNSKDSRKLLKLYCLDSRMDLDLFNKKNRRGTKASLKAFKEVKNSDGLLKFLKNKLKKRSKEDMNQTAFNLKIESIIDDTDIDRLLEINYDDDDGELQEPTSKDVIEEFIATTEVSEIENTHLNRDIPEENILQEKEKETLTSRKRSFEPCLGEYTEKEEPNSKKKLESFDDLLEQLKTSDKVLQVLKADKEKLHENQNRKLQELIYNHKFIINETVEKQKEDLQNFISKQKKEMEQLEQSQAEEKMDLMKANEKEEKQEDEKVEGHKKAILSIKERMKNHLKSEIKSELLNTSTIPECPHCSLPLLPPILIYQCCEGHIIGSCCKKSKDEKIKCKECDDGDFYFGRNKFMEESIKKQVNSETQLLSSLIE